MNIIDEGTYGRILETDDDSKVTKESDLYNDGYNWQSLKETIILSQYQFLGIPKIDKVEIADENIRLTMDYLGANLRQYFESSYNDENFDPETTTRFRSIDFIKKLIFEISKILIYLHGNNIIHNDLKPDNIMITDNEDIYLIDYGSAILTETQKSFCEPEYRAPETFWQNKITKASDIWALGLTCLWVLNNFTLKKCIQPITDYSPEFIDLKISTYLQDAQMESDFLRFESGTLEPDLVNLISRMLKFSEPQRITALEIYYHPLFSGVRGSVKKITIPIFDDIVNPRIDYIQRNSIVNLIFEICQKYPKSVGLSIWITDKYCSLKNMESGNFKYLAISAVILASSLYYPEEIEIDEFKEYFKPLNSRKIKSRIDKMIKDIISITYGSIHRQTFDRILNLGINDFQKMSSFCINNSMINKSQKQLANEY